MSPRSMTAMWSERVFVVNAVDRIGMTSQVLAVFTEREGPDGADAFCLAQPRFYYREPQPNFVRGRDETDEKLRQRIKRSDFERALGWRPCAIDKTYREYEVREFEIFVCDTPWNPPIATWPPSNPEIVRNAITLEEPGREVEPVADGEDIRRPGITPARFWGAPIEPMEFEQLPPQSGATPHVRMRPYMDGDNFHCVCGSNTHASPINGVYRCYSCDAVYWPAADGSEYEEHHFTPGEPSPFKGGH